MILRIRAVVCLLHCVYLLLSVIGEFVVRRMLVLWQI